MDSTGQTLRPTRIELRLAPAGLAALPFATIGLLVGWALGGTVALFAATAISVLTLTPLFCWLHARGLKLGAPMPVRAFALESFVLSLPLENASRRFRARDLLFAAGPERRQGPRPCGHVAQLEAGGHVRVAIAHRAGERGRSTKIELRAWSSYPFGLARTTLVFELPMELLVFPSLGSMADLGRLHAAAIDQAASLARPQRGEEELHGVREWRAGESMRRVHWKLSARRGRTIVRELRRPADPPVRVLLVLALDGRAVSRARKQAFETAVSLTATLCEHYLRRDRRVQLSLIGKTNGTSIELAGRRGLWRALALLAEVAAEEGDPREHLRRELAPDARAPLPTVAVFAARRIRPFTEDARRETRVLLDVDDPRTELVFQRGRSFGSRPPVGELLAG